MNRDEITKLLPELQIFLRTLRIFFLIFTIGIFGGYITALWLWSQEQILPAAIVASATFIVFYLFRLQLVEITCSYLKQDIKYTKMLYFINENLQKKGSKEFIDQLEKAISTIQKNQI